MEPSQQTHCKREGCLTPTTREDHSNARRGSNTACNLEQDPTATKLVEGEDVAEDLPPGPSTHAIQMRCIYECRTQRDDGHDQGATRETNKPDLASTHTNKTRQTSSQTNYAQALRRARSSANGPAKTRKHVHLLMQAVCKRRCHRKGNNQKGGLTAEDAPVDQSGAIEQRDSPTSTRSNVHRRFDEITQAHQASKEKTRPRVGACSTQRWNAHLEDT